MKALAVNKLGSVQMSADSIDLASAVDPANPGAPASLLPILAFSGGTTDFPALSEAAMGALPQGGEFAGPARCGLVELRVEMLGTDRK